MVIITVVLRPPMKRFLLLLLLTVSTLIPVKTSHALKFNLVFEDVINRRRINFDDPKTGETVRKAFISAFDTMASYFNSPAVIDVLMSSHIDSSTTSGGIWYSSRDDYHEDLFKAVPGNTFLDTLCWWKIVRGEDLNGANLPDINIDWNFYVKHYPDRDTDGVAGTLEDMLVTIPDHVRRRVVRTFGLLSYLERRPYNDLRVSRYDSFLYHLGEPLTAQDFSNGLVKGGNYFQLYDGNRLILDEETGYYDSPKDVSTALIRPDTDLRGDLTEIEFSIFKTLGYAIAREAKIAAFAKAIGGAQDIGYASYKSDWFGEYMVQQNFPWILHKKFGTFRVPGALVNDVWTDVTTDNLPLYDPELGWVMTKKGLYPWFYSYRYKSNIKFKGSGSPRHIYVQKLQRWIVVGRKKGR
jgi:hypothetical protein